MNQIQTEKDSFIMQTEPLDNIQMQPRKLYRYRFRTCHTLREGFAKSREKIWIRNTGIMYTGKANGLHHFHLLGFQTEFIQGTTAPAFNLLKETAYIFDDLRICLTGEGKIVSIKNLKKIKERWHQEREQLETFNRGASVQNYFDFLSQVLEDEQKISEYILSYTMYGMFFNGSHLGSLTPDESVMRKIVFPYSEDIFSENWKYISHSANEETTFTVKGKPAQTDSGSLYLGSFIYNSGILQEASLKITHQYNHTKYTVLWVG
ncbi:hypothetical protein O2K51_02595 [Apibacter raozihei]